MIRDETARRLSQAIVWLFAMNGFAILLAAAAGSVSDSSVAYWTYSVIGLGGPIAIAVTSGFGPAFYGLTLRNARIAVVHGLVSVVALSSLALAGLTLFQASGELPLSLALFEPKHDLETLAYALLSAPLQEFVFRGALQGSLRYILGPRRGAAALAIGFSTLAYAAMHLPWGLPAALIMIVPGLVWGWQYERDRTLLGVALAHAATGYLFVVATPLWVVLTG